MSREWQEESMDGDFATTVPSRRPDRWFDLCLRLVLIALAGAWLMMSPASHEQDQRDNRTTAVTR